MAKKPTSIKSLIDYFANPEHKYIRITAIRQYDHEPEPKITDYGRCEVVEITKDRLVMIPGNRQQMHLDPAGFTYLEDSIEARSINNPTGSLYFKIEYLPIDTDVQPIALRSLADIIHDNAANRNKYNDEFYNTFKIPLSHFWEGNMLGFDIVAFDKWLGVPEDQSTYEFIKNKFGDAAAEMVSNLLG